MVNASSSAALMEMQGGLLASKQCQVGTRPITALKSW
jgi:hypothetical protein